MSTLRLGSRGSQLALFQSRLVAERIRSAGGPDCEIVVIKTSGDRLQQAPLSEIGGKRLFVKEIEDALAAGEVDLAVHSSKDMPAVLPEGLAVGAVLEREDPRDALVLPAGASGKSSGRIFRTSGAENPPGGFSELTGRIGTGSVRRIAQLRSLFPQASFENVRGNLDTRLRKLDSGDFDALVLAAAGLRRLGFADRITTAVPIDECVPAPGQGIIAVETRSGDRRTGEAVAPINDADASAALDAERALVVALGGGCQMPLGGVATPVPPDGLELHAIVASLDGSRVIRYKRVGSRRDAAALGRAVAEELLQQGAASILEEAARHDSRNPDPRSLRLT